MQSNGLILAPAFALGCAALTLVPGVWTLATTPVSGMGADIGSGAVQRLYEERFEDGFPLSDQFRHGWTALKFAAFGEVSEGAIVGENGVLFTAEEFTAPNEPRDLAAALVAAKTQVEQAGATLVPVIVPDKARMLGLELPSRRSERFEARYDAAMAMIAAQGLPSVDLRPSLNNSAAWMVTDTHWSPEGAQQVASAIAGLTAGQITELSSFETIQTDEVPFDGDLLAFVDTGDWRSVVGPAQETIATYETTALSAASAGLFGDVVVPVALVGTSYSARPDFHFLGFLQSELGADVVSYAEVGQGPFVPMDEFLTSGALADAPPQIVLWEIPERYLDTWSMNQ